MHSHSNEPVVLMHSALPSQLSVSAVHSFTSVHVTPSPEKPLTQAHSKEPFVFWHVACTSQLSSWHVMPLPEKPGRHAHVNDPGELVHSALALQLWRVVWHSSMSEHVKPSPA